MSSSCEGQIFDHYKCLPLFCLSKPAKEAVEQNWWRILRCLRRDLMLRKIWVINADLLNWRENCIVGWHRWQCRSIWHFGIENWHPFNNSGAMMTEIEEKQWIILCLFGWPKFSGIWFNFSRIENLNWRQFGSIYKDGILRVEVTSAISSKKSCLWIPPLLSC